MLKVGMKVYRSNIYNEDNLNEYKIEKIGRKYFYISGVPFSIPNKIHDGKFFSTRNKKGSGQSTFYLDPKIRDREIIRRSKEEELDRLLQKWDSEFKIFYLSDEDLDKILNIVKNSIVERKRL